MATSERNKTGNPSNAGNDDVKSFTCKEALVLFASLIIILFIVNYPCLSGSYYYDDKAMIFNNKDIQIDSMSFDVLRKVLKSESVSWGRTIPMFTMALNGYFLGGDTSGFRAVNIVLHALAALGLAFILLDAVRSTFGDCENLTLKGGGKVDPAPWIAGAFSIVWAMHPMHASTVAYIYQRATIMTGAAGFWSLFFYVRFLRTGRVKSLILSIIILTCGLKCKETIASAPVGFLLY